MPIDPTRTTVLRQSALSAITKRLNWIQLELTNRAQETILQMSSPVSVLTNLRSLVEWVVKNEISVTVIDKYLATAYRRAASEVLMNRGIAQQLREPSFELLRQGVHNDVEGLKNKLVQDISHEMGQNIVKSVGISTILRSIRPVLARVKDNSARLLVDTAIVRAHNEAKLDMLELLGDKQVSVLVEVRISNKACPQCAAYRNRILTIKQARGLFPIHPTCRCSISPVARTQKKLRLLNS